MADSSEQSLLLDPAAAAELLGVTIWTLERWRRQELGPIFVRLARKIHKCSNEKATDTLQLC
jgi:hypothetical protein